MIKPRKWRKIGNELLKRKHAPFFFDTQSKNGCPRFNAPASQGFTLAEVLVTLAVIGVVASLTIPTLMKTSEKQQTLTGLKKAMSVGNQALKMAALDNCGSDDLSCIFGSTATAGNAIAEQYKVIKNCGINSGEGCFAEFNSDFDGSGSNYNWGNSTSYYKFITTDGMSIMIYSYNNCTNDYGISNNSPMAKFCGNFYVDINGPNKGPNYQGRDIFLFYITSNKGAVLYPRGGWDDNANGGGSEATGGGNYWNYNDFNLCSSSVSTDGGPCTGRIIEKGWQIDYY